MASVYRRKRSPFVWIKYRDHDGNIVRKSSGIDDETEAQEFANNIESICKIAREHNGSIRSGALEELVRLGVIDASELIPKRPKPDVDPLDLEALALAHPTVLHEKSHRPGDYKAHMNRLREFRDATGVTTLRDLTSSVARAYLKSLIDKGMSKDQIRHRLLYLRAAASMGSERGVPNPIAKLRIPRGTKQAPPPRTLTLAELAAVLFPRKKNPALTSRMRIIIALQATMGLGLSEVCRLQWSSWRDGTLHVGSTKAKNEYRNRLLPIPATLNGWITELRHSRHDWPSKLMLSGVSNPIGEQLSEDTTSTLVNSYLRDATGDRSISAKCLRKSFASIAVWELSMPPEVVESFLGRRISTLGQTTARHYLARAHLDRLKPWAEAMDTALLAAREAHKMGTLKSKS